MKTNFAHYEHKVMIPYSEVTGKNYNDMYSWLSNELDWNDRSWSEEVIDPQEGKSYVLFSFKDGRDATMFALLFGGKGSE